ncbi:hypothetical protein O6455_25065, partial [Salmonella enterica subsp. enterica]
GLLEICEKAGAKVSGMGIVIEKSFQKGRQIVEESGIEIASLARIAAFEDGVVKFVPQEDK